MQREQARCVVFANASGAPDEVWPEDVLSDEDYAVGWALCGLAMWAGMLEAECNRLCLDMAMFGQHKDWCATENGGEPEDCECGFTEALGDAGFYVKVTRMVLGVEDSP